MPASSERARCTILLRCRRGRPPAADRRGPERSSAPPFFPAPLTSHGVVMHCFSFYGFYTGSFYPRETNVSGDLLVRQVQHYLDSDLRLFLAREFVSGALFHLRRNLNYYRHRGKAVDEALAKVDLSAERLSCCSTIPELMREEGQAREAYYAAFNQILELEEPFEKRVTKSNGRRLPSGGLASLPRS